MAAILIMPAKFATLGLLEIKVVLNKGYSVIAFVNDINDKFLSRDSNYIVCVAMRPKFFISSTSDFFKGWSWLKFNHLGRVLGIDLKFYSSMVKKLKLKFRKF